MIVTARQLEDLHKSNGQVTLPRAARLTPLAVDWIKAKRIVIAFEDGELGAPATSGDGAAAALMTPADCAAAVAKFLWWCDGPCGPAKAALVAQGRESSLAALAQAADPRNIVPAIKELARGIRSGNAAGGVLLVQTGSLAMVYANRCPSLRAVLGTCLDAVEQGVRSVAANVLVIEHPYKTLSQVSNLLGRFLNAKRELAPQVKQQLQELASCG
ncbi:MAG TPA: RpiB/LacA/LacB family sugar-phosphate isomerase [Tepidisphaeraceae bacterium]|jgi:ribose 5-phosphate isomerase RpiB